MGVRATGRERGAERSADFARRHIGPGEKETQAMLEALGLESLEQLVDETVPRSLRLGTPLTLDPPLSEGEALEESLRMSRANRVARSYIGLGYSECITPAAIRRGILECPGWYTAYTPYQPEISQGRLEALLNFQTMVADLTALPIANASMLDEATAAAEAMLLCRRVLARKDRGDRFLVDTSCHPQTIEVVRMRAEPLGIEVVTGDAAGFEIDDSVFGVLVQYPATDGRIVEIGPLLGAVRDAGAMSIVATDLLALTLLTPPGELGADVAVGSSQRFGVPLGYGGPHAGFLAAREDHLRQIPGRVVGVSRDAEGRPALRLALQTREQHIRRDRATSNICTAQVLLAVVASMYAVYHGPGGLARMARRVRGLTEALAGRLRSAGLSVTGGPLFDTLRVEPVGLDADAVHARASERGMNLRRYDDGGIGVSLGEPADAADVASILEAFGVADGASPDAVAAEAASVAELPGPFARTSAYLEHPTFHRFRSETELMRYMHRLETRDLSLNASMIPLGSCTMKLNAASEMIPVTWSGYGSVHPFAPEEDGAGYRELFDRLTAQLAEITGLPAVSLMPNAGAQGEYAGLLVIRAWHLSRGDTQRDVCLIPQSAHGTNPASAVLAGMTVVVLKCDADGEIDLDDLKAKIGKHEGRIGALMVTYPSTHGVFEENIRAVCDLVHDAGGQVYLDGANMNAMVGVCRPGEFGADVCHLNLHKTFCIPHGGGGPGMGPICAAPHLAPFMPRHPLVETGGEQGIGPVSAAPFGSPSILPISWSYIAMMGAEGLERATAVAILAANYVARRLDGHYSILYRGRGGRVAHECIVDVRPFKRSAGIEVDDIAKRLMDYGFHAPTMSWPVVGTLMIEPTESESKEELDRFCDAMIAIREEIRAVEEGRLPRDDNPLKNAPHTLASLTADEWSHPYPRRVGAWPAPWLAEHKVWPFVARIDHVYGDRNVHCTCPPLEAYGEE